MIKAAIHKTFRFFGLDIVEFPGQEQACPSDFGKDETEIVRPRTMTSVERIYALIQALRYVSANDIAGDIVECGVWKGEAWPQLLGRSSSCRM